MCYVFEKKLYLHFFTVLKRIFFFNESESRILFVIQKIFESESESYS